MAVQPVPDGYHTVSPYLAVEDAAAAIDFYKKAFGATERIRMETPDGRIGHAELEIGDSLVMVSDVQPQSATKPPTELGADTGGVFLYVDDVDEVVVAATDSGATITQ